MRNFEWGEGSVFIFWASCCSSGEGSNEEDNQKVSFLASVFSSSYLVPYVACVDRIRFIIIPFCLFLIIRTLGTSC